MNYVKLIQSCCWLAKSLYFRRQATAQMQIEVKKNKIKVKTTLHFAMHTSIRSIEIQPENVVRTINWFDTEQFSNVQTAFSYWLATTIIVIQFITTQMRLVRREDLANHYFQEKGDGACVQCLQIHQEGDCPSVHALPTLDRNNGNSIALFGSAEDIRATPRPCRMRPYNKAEETGAGAQKAVAWALISVSMNREPSCLCPVSVLLHGHMQTGLQWQWKHPPSFGWDGPSY